MTPVIVVLTPGGLATANRMQAAVGGEVHVLRKPGAVSFSYGERGSAYPPEIVFADAASHLRELFAADRPIVGICAAGILIRILAPCLTDKRAEPPVLAVSEDGASIVPLLGGHRGANDLARDLAAALGGHAAITTAGDRRGGIALDAPPPGWTLANPENAKSVMAALLAGASARLEGECAWLAESGLPLAQDGPIRLVATTRMTTGDDCTLVYHPRRLALGLGCERGADPAELIGLGQRALHEAGLAPDAVACIASLDLKADEPAILDAAREFEVPARFFPAEDLEAETERLANPSESVFREVGCHGVAEGAALAAAGPQSALIVAKQKGPRTTCAIAESPAIIDPNSVGRARGRLAIVGIGPGSSEWLTPEARRLLEASDAAVGYSLYLDLIAPLVAQAERFDSALGSEEDRARRALELAATGRSVALVSSGDAGIYAMASLVFECLETGGLPDAARRIEIVVAPGISALQAAAARTGAPLGHDFCAVSLSDLLTPAGTIVTRVRAAAEGDFVIAFYNPVSQRRRTLLESAKAILLQHRPADTPVVLARNLGREGENVTTVALADLEVEMADMLTLVLVGASTTRRVTLGGRSWVYTPRGYAAKRLGEGQPAVELGSNDPSPSPSPQAPQGGGGMTIVHFIGAGPGAPDLITVRGLRLIERCPVCLYAGSLVRAEVVASAPTGARVLDTAAMTLDEIVAEMADAVANGREVARVHSGDPSLYGAIAEQIRRLQALGIAYDVTPGVPAFAAAAAALGRELTIPEVSQTVILTRTAMKSSAMPEGEDLATLARSGALLVIHLSIRNLLEIERQLSPAYGVDCPVIVAYRVGWPDEAFVHGTLSDIRDKVRAAKITRTALIFVGRALGDADFRNSALYDAGHVHVLRPKRKPVSGAAVDHVGE